MRSVLRVLTYHRVLDPADAVATDPTLISATPGVFDRQMRHLAEHYHPVSGEEVVEAARGGRRLPDRAVLVTFDDAYRDFGEVAWPILRHHRVPATVFVPTAYPDHPERAFWWDRLYQAVPASPAARLEVGSLGTFDLDTPEARRVSIRTLQTLLKKIPHTEAMSLVEEICTSLGYRRMPFASVLGWSELRSLAREGVTLCAHTRTHPALDQLPLAEARAEIRGAFEDLQGELGSSVLRIFAYPFGALNDEVVELVREEGFELAVTSADGHNPTDFREPLLLRRTNITMRTSPALFALRLMTFFTHIDRWRHQSPGAVVQRRPQGLAPI